MLQDIKCAGFALGDKIAHSRAKAAHVAPAALVQHAHQAFLHTIDDNAARRRHGANQMVELALDCSEIVKDVGVIEFQVVQHGCARAVMHELAALVEKGRVVFIGLDHEQWRCRQGPCARNGPGGRTQAGRHTKIQRNAADQKTRLQAGAFQNPGQHRGGCRLAMGARHGQYVAPLQDMLGQPLRPAGVGAARVEDGFHQGKLRAAIGQAGAADHVAHHKHIGFQCHLVGAIAFDQFDVERAQLVAHGRVDAGVAAGHLVACSACECRQAAHEGATDAQNVYMHGCRF